MALTKTQVSELYVAIFGRASEGEGNKFWQTVDASAAEIADEMLTTAPAQEYFGETLNSPLEFIKHIYLNTLGRTYEDDAEGIDYWSGRLEAGESHGAIVVELISVLQNSENTGDAQDSFKNRVEVSDYTADTLFAVPADVDTALSFSAEGLNVNEDPATVAAAESKVDAIAQGEGEEPGEPEEPGVEGETIQLTEGRDVATGTADKDTFYGDVGQNQNGDLVNEFSTGDRLDGGAGRDKIVATMINDYTSQNSNSNVNNLAPRPITNNIEEVYIEALEDVTINATRMANVEEYWSNWSDADLAFQGVNLNGNNLSITKDVTFGIRDTKFGTDFTAMFDSQSLLRAPEQASNSQLLIRIADVSTETPATPLANVSVTLGFELDGINYVLNDVVSTDGTYQGLVNAIDAALAAEGLPALNVSLSAPYDQVTFAGNTVNLPFTAQEILITDPSGAEFDSVNFTQAAIQPVAGGFLVAGNADPVDPSVSSNLIESNLILDNAGRGSFAGDVQIGGESNSPIGVERFNVSVDRTSKITSLTQTSTNAGALDEIYIGSQGANGSLAIGRIDSGLSVVNATAFEGANLSIGTIVTPVINLESFNSAGSATNVSLVAVYDGDVLPSNKQAFTINTGSGSDAITADLTGTSTSGSTTASLTVNSSGGNNVVTLSSDGTEINNATVVLGSGVDVVTGGMTHLTVNTGGGNDVIYAENTGDKTVAQINNGVFAATAATTAMHGSTVNNIELLGGRQVQVTLGLPDGSTTPLANAFVDGLEVVADIVASNGVLTTERDLYDAVAKAINEDAVLNKLAFASVDSNGHLTVSYLVDGVSALNDVAVTIEVLGTYADLNTTQANNLLQAVKEKYSNSTIDAADITAGYNAAATADSADVTVAGTDSVINGGLNVVNGGAGDDVIVLSSDSATIDTVVFDAGQFGNDTVVHFNAGALGDKLDFTAWMNNKTSASSSVESQVDAASALVLAPGAITANDVVVVDFNALPALAPGVTFDSLSNADVLGALTNAGGFTVGSTAGLVGTTQNSILMVQNWDGAAGNYGEYKVYQVVSDNAVGDGFISATLVGSVDFGEAQSFHIDNVA